MKKINILRIFFIAILAFIAIGAFLKSERIETNLLRAFFSDNAKDELLVELSGKYSSNINVLIESSNPDLIEKAKEEFVKNIDKKSFEIKSANFVKTLEFYKKYATHNWIVGKIGIFGYSAILLFLMLAIVIVIASINKINISCIYSYTCNLIRQNIF